MLPLILTILCSLSISLLLTLNEKRRGDRMVAAAANYGVAALLGLVMAKGRIDLPPEWLGASLLIGAGFVAGFLLLMRSIRSVGLAVTGSVARIASLGPVLLSILFYNEQPSGTAWIGIGLGVVAFLLLGLGSRGRPAVEQDDAPVELSAALLLLAVVVVMTANDFAMKVAQVNGLDSGSVLAVVFAGAASLCGVMLWARRGSLWEMSPFAGRDLLLGALLGVPNFFSSYFLVAALHALPASTVFPIVSAGGVVLAALAGLLLWKERPSALAWLGIGLAAVAVGLLGMESS